LIPTLLNDTILNDVIQLIRFTVYLKRELKK